MLELSENLPVRTFRLEANYTAARLKALDETRHLAKDFEEAADKFALLEQEESQLAVRRMEIQAQVETADDAWDDTMIAFRNRLLELCGHNTDAELYRQYFAEIPSHVTSLSYAAEIMISKELEQHLEEEESEELRVFSERLADKRSDLERIMKERTHLEVEEARFHNRVQLAKQILNKLRRVLWASLEEVQMAHGRSKAWCARFFFSHNDVFSAMDRDGVETPGLEDGPLLASHGGAGNTEAEASA